MLSHRFSTIATPRNRAYRQQIRSFFGGILSHPVFPLIHKERKRESPGNLKKGSETLPEGFLCLLPQVQRVKNNDQGAQRGDSKHYLTVT